MKKKEISIIFVLAILVTGGSWFWEMATIGLRNDHGFPFKFYFWVMGGGTSGKPQFEIHYTTMTPQWNYLNLVIDFFFLFLVLAVGWWVVRQIQRW